MFISTGILIQGNTEQPSSLNTARADIKNSASGGEIPVKKSISACISRSVKNLKHTVGILDAAISEVKDGCDIDMNRLILIMESMESGNPYTFVVRYFTDDQLKNYAVRLLTSSDSPDSVKDIFGCLDKLYLQGADPAGRDGQDLAERWWNIVNQDGSQGQIVQSQLAANLPFKHIVTDMTPEESQKLLDRRAVQMIIVIPENFISNLAKGKPEEELSII